MASLIEELVNVLNEEEKIYRQLVESGKEKREILINADIESLEKLTEKEQSLGDDLLARSNEQVRLLKDIASVLGRSNEQLTVSRILDLLSSQPEAVELLTKARDSLLQTAGELQQINEQNEALLNQAIELTEFDITLLKSLRQAPETANYNRNAYNTGSILGGSGFDAKQ